MYVGLNIHKILIEIVKKITSSFTNITFESEKSDEEDVSLPFDFGRGKSVFQNPPSNISADIEEKSDEKQKIVEKNSSGVLKRIFEVLRLVVFDNKATCNAMKHEILELAVLLPLNDDI